MNNRDKWKPTKYVFKNEKLVSSRDSNEVGVASRLVTDLTAENYQSYLKHHARGRLLDLGCGNVPLFYAYKDFVSENICVDWTNSLHQNDHLDFELDLTRPLPFQNGEFDTIILSDVLEHVPQPEDLWREMSRVLSIGGKVIMNVPFYYWLHEQPHDYYRYTEFALRRFVEKCGLEVVELKSVGGAPEIMTDIFAKNISRVPKIGRFVAAFSQWVMFVLLKTCLGKKMSNSTKDTFPLGYFLIAQKKG